ncbi:hypothetical protein RND71_012165 [Anisodus tanguticus]|uniref:Uncharacterized protein n=1 Tax=Anisodus tanguticus TaxID=243964 RepID=A0AAE1SFC0_9SOLA|nr:hypothetical protein RND71_012165 [Anisodus tanguticus]
MQLAPTVSCLCTSNGQKFPGLDMLLKVGCKLGECRILLCEPGVKHKLQKLQLNFPRQQGIAMLTSSSPPSYRIVCNQLRDDLQIPNPQYPSLCIILEFVPITSNPYGGVVKLVSVHEDDGNNLRYEVLSLEIGPCPCWRAIDNVPPSDGRKRKSMQFFFRMGVAYCICFFDDLDRQVDVLDMINETYTGRRAHFDLSMMSSTTHLLDWNGRLSFAQLLKDELHVLILDDPTKLKWAETKRIIKLQFLKPSSYHYNKDELITFHACADKSTMLFLWKVNKDNKSLCYYDIYTGELSTCKLHPTSFSTITDDELVALEVARFALCKAGL